MHLIAGWSILAVAFLAAISVATLADARSRSIANWVVLPLLLEAAVVQWLYMHVS